MDIERRIKNRYHVGSATAAGASDSVHCLQRYSITTSAGRAIYGDVKMNFDYRMPAGYWEAGSRKSAARLAKLMQELMNIRGVKVRSHYVGFLENSRLIGYDVKLDFGESVSIKFSDDGAGSTLKISLFPEDKDRGTFLEIWQNLIDAGYVFDEHFKRKVKPKEEKPKQETIKPQDKSGEGGNVQTDTKKELKRIKYSRVSAEWKKIILEAFEISNESPENFVKHTVSYMANQYFPKNSNQVLFIFEQEIEKRKEKNDPTHVHIDYFISPDGLYKWKNEKRKVKK